MIQVLKNDLCLLFPWWGVGMLYSHKNVESYY